MTIFVQRARKVLAFHIENAVVEMVTIYELMAKHVMVSKRRVSVKNGHIH